MSKPTKEPIPKFKTKAQERAYWESHDSSEHVDWDEAHMVKMPHLRPTSGSPRLTDPAAPSAPSAPANTIH